MKCAINRFPSTEVLDLLDALPGLSRWCLRFWYELRSRRPAHVGVVPLGRPLGGSYVGTCRIRLEARGNETLKTGAPPRSAELWNVQAPFGSGYSTS